MCMAFAFVWNSASLLLKLSYDKAHCQPMSCTVSGEPSLNIYMLRNIMLQCKLLLHYYSVELALLELLNVLRWAV